jgi:copper(I)-binding protein
MKTILLAAAAAFTLATPAFAHMGMEHGGCPAGQTFTSGDISVTGAFSRATLPNAKSGGGFMTITNAGSAPDRLIGAKTENAARSEIHQMKMDGDVMKMNAVEGGLEIPAGGSVTLAPGGYHVMMMGLKQPLAPSECLELTLSFEKSGDLPVELNIGPTDADAAPMDHEGHH